MPTQITPQQRQRARSLRNNLADGEKRLWQELRHFKKHYGIHVRRQVAIENYVADFAILKQR
jgi:very-short-patch-repair endonuclease